ncbi:MAG: hypothetical protein LZF60_140018 [Nitrospira sp.]|nr:MAG: hypothetical protein LZF60_140018 [Nitrospira sp.]
MQSGGVSSSMREPPRLRSGEVHEQARTVHRLVTVNTVFEAYNFPLTLVRKLCQQENRP